MQIRLWKPICKENWYLPVQPAIITMRKVIPAANTKKVTHVEVTVEADVAEAAAAHRIPLQDEM